MIVAVGSPLPTIRCLCGSYASPVTWTTETGNRADSVDRARWGLQAGASVVPGYQDPESEMISLQGRAIHVA